MYESHFTCHFFRYWGFLEGRNKEQMVEPLLGNMQNPFDALFGDIVGQTEGRFFIIEFKRDRKDFASEVKEKSGKAHRRELYRHLREDTTCRDISRLGHFGGYPNESDQLCFEPYAHCMAPMQSPRNISDEIILNDVAFGPLGARSWHVDFSTLYKQLTHYDSTMSAQAPGSFSDGLEITHDQLEEYVACMYNHLQQRVNIKGQAVLGMVDAQTGQFTAVVQSLPLLVQALHDHFAAMRAALTNRPRPRSAP